MGSLFHDIEKGQNWLHVFKELDPDTIQGSVTPGSMEFRVVFRTPLNYHEVVKIFQNNDVFNQDSRLYVSELTEEDEKYARLLAAPKATSHGPFFCEYDINTMIPHPICNKPR